MRLATTHRRNVLIYALQTYELHLRRTAWQTKKSQHSVRIRFAPVRRNPTANTAARRAKAPVKRSSSIVIAGTTGARAISKPPESYLTGREAPRRLSFGISALHCTALRFTIGVLAPGRSTPEGNDTQLIHEAMVSVFSASVKEMAQARVR